MAPRKGGGIAKTIPVSGCKEFSHCLALQKILNPDKSSEGGLQLIIGLLKVGSFSEET